MACTGTNWKRRKDIVYMTFIAEMFSKGTGKEIGIYERSTREVGKIYDFEEVEEGKSYIKVIRFDKYANGKDVLSDNEGKGLDTIDNIGESDTVTASGNMDENSGGVLQAKQPDTISNRPKKSDKNRKPKK